MIEGIIEKVKQEISGKNVINLAEKIWTIDRVSGFTNFHKSADLCFDQMKKAGLKDVKILQFKADGVSKYGDYVIPQAWDAESAELHLIEPEESANLLASYIDSPNHLFMYSASTPEKGFVSEVVWVKGKKLIDYEKADLKGKIVFTSHRPTVIWKYAEKTGAVGIICDYAECRNQHSGIGWQNYSFVPKNNKRLFGFSVTYEKGAFLKKIFSEGKKIKVSAKVKTRFYNGTADLVTGIIPGTTKKKEEIWIFAHLYEIGAWDNASGSASVVEIGRTLSELIKNKILSRPKRTIRFMLGWECYGLMCYLVSHLRDLDNFIAGITLDSIGLDYKYKVPLGISSTPESNPAFIDYLLEKI